LWTRNHHQITITITALAGFGTAHATSLVALGFAPAGFVAAAACRGDVGHGLKGKMVVYGGGGTASVFGIIELNATTEEKGEWGKVGIAD